MPNRFASAWRALTARVDDGDPKTHGGYLGYWPARFLPSDVPLTADDALSISAVWACVDYIAKSLASCDWRIFERDSRRNRKEIPEDSLNWILNVRPNEDTTAMALREALVSLAIVYGDGYLEIQRTLGNKVFALHLLPSTLVTPQRNAAGKMEYLYKPDSGNAAQRIIPAKDCFHLKGPSLTSFLGESLITRAARSIAIAKAADEFALSFYSNNTVVGGVLEVTKPLTDKERERLRAEFEESRKGAAKAHRPTVLTAGTKWSPLSVESDKAQVVESRRHSVDDICRFFGIPPTVIGHLDKASWNNVEHLSIVTVRDCLRPWARRLEQEANAKLFVERSPRYSELDLRPLMHGDAKSRAEAYQIQRRNGIISANEWRDMEGMDPVGPEGDLLVIEANMTLLDEEALMPPEPAPAPGPAAAAPGDTGGDSGGDTGEDPEEAAPAPGEPTGEDTENG